MFRQRGFPDEERLERRRTFQRDRASNRRARESVEQREERLSRQRAVLPGTDANWREH